ncbi:MAG TPA: hypothetical protein VEW71_04950 [Allosphingosinicella sp.]|nr:hypothetical protein [Allosphingosinicella sp.]
MVNFITPEQAAELRSLYERLPAAAASAAAEFKTEPPLHIWDDAARARFREKDLIVGEIFRRIREIQGG